MDINNFGVKMWEEEVEIPTYPVGKPDKNPMFLEKRVYQGSSGKVYPIPVIDKIYDDKTIKKYKMVFLENQYLQVWILPELGGRIQRALDKTNQYDFVYYNHVIKPALVGLAGPWISGGIEFNWPQHHRPNTYGPVEYTLKENVDGSKTVWVSEIDSMYRTKVTTGFTLYPDKAYIEIHAKMYNGTYEPQTFLWWANPAVEVNNDTQSIFPPDVNAVMDHGKRDVSEFPIAKGTYYKVDYSAGVDISRYKNLPVPTSYMAYHSDYNFIGGYDYEKKAGLLHVADHHISPGKKQWTWGNGDFGQAWDRNLTDDDGPYIELMTGVYTDNQPDFTWLNPFEQKSFKQYFMPYKKLGTVKNATINAAVNLEIVEKKAGVSVYATSLYEDAIITIAGKNSIYFSQTATISPINVFENEFDLNIEEDESDLIVTVRSSIGEILVEYRPRKKEEVETPAPAKPIEAPEALTSNEALFLAGMHLEQYRHATYEPDGYYLEGLRRDSSDIRLNNAYGKLLFSRGLFEESEKYFRTAVQTSSKHNTNLYDGEPLYYLGLSLKMQNRIEEAYGFFYKACWSEAMQSAAYFALSQIDAIKGDFAKAIEHSEKALNRNTNHYKAANLKTAILRKCGRYSEAKACAISTLEKDVLDFGARNELYLAALESGDKNVAVILEALTSIMRDDSKNYIELSIDYINAGLYTEGAQVLLRIAHKKTSPMVYYHLALCYSFMNQKEKSVEWCHKGSQASPDYCFPNRLEDIIALNNALEILPKDSKASYYFGDLWYDKKQYNRAISCWEKARDLDGSFATVHRNLALAYFNKNHEPLKAIKSMESAFSLNVKDARVFLELDQLYKKNGVSFKKRLDNFNRNFNLVEMRDDLYTEYITLLNLNGHYEKSKDLILSRNFHPWEGGEGKITTQYVQICIEMGKCFLKKGNYTEAYEILLKSLSFPHNLGEGKLYGTQENNKNYYLGCACEGLSDLKMAKTYFELASSGLDEPVCPLYYNDQPPEMIFYQGLALIKLNRLKEAEDRFHKLVNYGQKHLNDHVTIDYFAVSLPDFLIFEEDLNKRNKIHCFYLIALGYLGLKDKVNSAKAFDMVLKMDTNHQGANIHIKLIHEL